MADSAAFYGLIAAIGAALVGAIAAVTAPILQFRGAERLRRRSLADAEIESLVALRRTTRDALAVLSEGVGVLESGGTLDSDAFEESLASALRQVEEAADQAAVHGLVILVSQWDYAGPVEGRRRSRLSLRQRLARLQRQWPTPLTPEQRTLIPFIRDIGARVPGTARLIRDRDTEGLAFPGNTPRSLRLRTQEAERIRGKLIRSLLDRIEDLRDH